jgi:hypothetical protein
MFYNITVYILLMETEIYMRFFMRAGAFLLALILLLSSLVGCAATVKPLNYLKDVLQKTVSRRFGGELLELIPELMQGGSLTLGYGGSDLYATPLEAGEAKLYFDLGEGRFTALTSATVAGKTYDGKLFFSEDALVLSSTAMFGSTDLGVSFDTLKKDFEGSVFGNHSGNKYSRPEIGTDAADKANGLKDGLLSLYASLEELASLSDEIADEFLEILTDYAPHSRYAEKGTIYVTATVDNTVLSRTLRNLRVRMIKDKTFCRELRELAALKDRMASVKSGIEETKWSDKVEEFIASDIGVNELCNKIDASPAFTVALDCAVDRSARVLERGSLTYAVEGATVWSFSADLSDKSTNVLSLLWGGTLRTLTYRVEKDGLNRYASALDYKKSTEGGEELIHVTGTLAADRKADAFTLSLCRGAETRVFTGRFDKKIDGFEVSVDTATVNGEARRLSMSLAVKVGDEAEKCPDHVNLITITEAQLDPIAERAVAARAAFKTAWGDTKLDRYEVLSCFLTLAGVPEEIPTRPAPPTDTQ